MPNPVIHPGSVLLGHMLASDWKLSELAEKLGESPDMLQDFLQTFEDITPELASKIAALMGTGEAYWLNLQASYDAAHAETVVKAAS